MKEDPSFEDLKAEKERQQLEHYRKVLDQEKTGEPVMPVFFQLTKKYRDKIKIKFGG